MASWPNDNRFKRAASHHPRKGWPILEENMPQPWAFPELAPGLLGAATVVHNENDGNEEWVFAGGNKSAYTRRKGIKVFSATRPPPSSSQNHRDPRPEQAVDYIRTYFPDVDVSAEVIKEEMQADARQLSQFNAQIGNVMDVVHCGPEQETFLCFPVGQTEVDIANGELRYALNMAPFISDGIRLASVSSIPYWSFTPILQVACASSDTSAIMAIRNFDSVNFMEVTATNDGHPARANLSFPQKIFSTDTGNRPTVDISVSATGTNHILVNDRGAVYQCDFSANRKLRMVYAPAEKDADADSFWRLAATESDQKWILSQSRAVHLLDIRSRNDLMTIYSNGKLDRFITSVEYCVNDHLIRLADTSELLWIDIRNHIRPLLGYKHGRSFDRTLRSQTVETNEGSKTFLSSRKTNLVSIYEMDHTLDVPIHAHGSAYSISPIGSATVLPESLTIVQRQEHQWPLLYELSVTGEIYCLDFDSDDTADMADIGTRRLPESIEPIQDTVGALAWKRSIEVDMTPIYQNLSRQRTPSGDFTAVYDVLANMPVFWQVSEEPTEHMLTTFDVAFMSGEEPQKFNRADFLSESILSSSIGYRALVQGRIPQEGITKAVSWHYNAVPFLRLFIPEMSEQPAILFENFRKYFIIPDGDDESEQMDHNQDACEQLTLDLTLSADIYSDVPFSKALENVTESRDAVSWGPQTTDALDEPSQIRFGYLRPVNKSPEILESGGEIQSSSHAYKAPLAARLLLHEWTVGDDPSLYEYTDPYGSDGHSYGAVKVSRPVVSQTRSQLVSHPIITAPAAPTRSTRNVISQSTNREETTILTQPVGVPSSQFSTTAPQVLARTLSSQQQQTAKKAPKKRLGGF